MEKEYAIYPFRTMNITQNYDEGNHIPHWKNSKDHSDKPWDEACEDSGRSYFEPQNDFIIEEVLGLNTSTTNTVRLKSVNKLYIPYKNEPDYLYITLTHMNEDNLKQVKKGDILKKGTKILREGTDGNATGNHFHITANLGKYYGLLKNSNGKWCYTYAKSLLPEEAFYLDESYTKIKNSKNRPFKIKPILQVQQDDGKDKKIEELTNEINNKNSIINELRQQVDSLLVQIKDLEVKIEEFETKAKLEQPIFVYKAPRTDKFIIDLNKGEELRIYER